MSERLLGLETEYGFTVRPTPSANASRASPLEELLVRARAKHAFLPTAQGGGIFLPNGGRFLIDTGGHPEFCTPEVDNPWDAVRYACTGDALLQGLAADLRDAAWDCIVFKGNVDYSGARTTWASHENYSHRASPRGLPPQLLPFLVSRIVFTGAGGFNPFAPGIELCLSPRAYHLQHPVSDNSTSDRGLYHTKDESLAGEGWHRLHLICGETLCSHQATWLRMGTTALVLALAEAGLKPGEGLQLAAPLEALRAFTADCSLQATARLSDGARLTAVQIQRRYLERVEQGLGRAVLPSWAPAVCVAWREMLERLERAPGSLANTLDWAIKWALYQDQMERRDWPAAQVARWNDALAKLETAFAAEDARVWALTQPDPANQAQRRHAPPAFRAALASHGLAWEDLDRFAQLKHELCELELRFGQLGPEGLFNTLERGGHLRHRLAEVDDAAIQAALTEPPRNGRARLRGEWVRTLAGRAGAACDWTGVLDGDGRWLDLGDPSGRHLPPWRKAATADGLGPEPAEVVESWFSEIDRDYDRGCYERARTAFRRVLWRHSLLLRQIPARYFHSLAWIECRRGQGPESLRALAEFAAHEPNSPLLAVDQVGVRRFQGLGPGSDVAPWIAAAQRQLEAQGSPDPSLLLPLQTYQGFVLARTGAVAEGRAILETACAQARAVGLPHRLLARGLADLSEADRLLGDPAAAQRRLDEAEPLQRGGEYLADLAEFTLTQRAKLSRDPEQCGGWLKEARRLQVRLRHRAGLVRTLVLEARLCPSAWRNQRRRVVLEDLRRRLPSLEQCPRLRAILNQWDSWCAGGLLPGEADYFWGI